MKIVENGSGMDKMSNLLTLFYHDMTTTLVSLTQSYKSSFVLNSIEHSWNLSCS